MEIDPFAGGSEIRRDYRTGFYALIAPKRGSRPVELEEEDVGATDLKSCPFETGNESLTTEIMHHGEPWTLRVIENKFPEFRGTTPLAFRNTSNGLVQYATGYGYNEIVIFSPNHTDTLATISQEAALDWLNALIEREESLYARKRIRYVEVFHNHGVTAGASLGHPHTQIAAWPVIIGNIRREMGVADKYRRENDSCLYEDVYEVEKIRLLAENETFFAVAPFGSRITAESMIVPKRHVGYLPDLTSEEKRDLVALLRSVLRTNQELYGKQAYNFTIHDIKDSPDYHMHLEIYPRMSTLAGIELGQNVFVNKISPEEYAESFRNSLVESD